MKKILLCLLCLMMLMGSISGYAHSEVAEPEETDVTVEETIAYTDMVPLADAPLENEAQAMAAEPAVITLLQPEASGVKTKSGSKTLIDYSNVKDGYVMVKYNAPSNKRLKVLVAGPTTTYNYNLTPEKWETFPLSDGNGTYKVTVYRNITDNKYSTLLSATVKVELSDEFAPYIRPNQYVDYGAAEKTIAKAAELTAGKTTALEKVKAVYDYVVTNITYDKQLAATVKSGYLPVLDHVLTSGKGICFDYAALMTGMLRSQGVPCKLVIGYAGAAYHAWISVYSPETGWIEGVVYFDGTNWQRMDPTYASTGKQSPTIMKYISNNANYTTKYLY